MGAKVRRGARTYLSNPLLLHLLETYDSADTLVADTKLNTGKRHGCTITLHALVDGLS
jgi:hypothetical protein